MLDGEGHAGFVMTRRSAPVVEAVHRSADTRCARAPSPSSGWQASVWEATPTWARPPGTGAGWPAARASPLLRQVRLIAAELQAELRVAGFMVGPAEMGENVTTRGVDLLAVPVGTRLNFGPDAVVEITGSRTPCRRLERLQESLLGQSVVRTQAGVPIRKAGVTAVVVAGGDVSSGDPIAVVLPAPPHRRPAPV